MLRETGLFLPRNQKIPRLGVFAVCFTPVIRAFPLNLALIDPHNPQSILSRVNPTGIIMAAVVDYQHGERADKAEMEEGTWQEIQSHVAALASLATGHRLLLPAAALAGNA